MSEFKKLSSLSEQDRAVEEVMQRFVSMEAVHNAVRKEVVERVKGFLDANSDYFDDFIIVGEGKKPGKFVDKLFVQLGFNESNHFLEAVERACVDAIYSEIINHFSYIADAIQDGKINEEQSLTVGEVKKALGKE